MNTSVAPVHRSEPLESFGISYGSIHGYVSLAICAVGIPLNIINVIVLSRKNLQTPINCVLTWLAVSDMATMISYVPFAYHFYCRHSVNDISSEKNNFGWMTFLLIYLNFSATTHTISIWLAVGLAMLRHHHIHSKDKGNLTRMRRLVRARLVVGVIVLCSVLVMVPNYLSHSIEETVFPDNSTGYIFTDWNLNSRNTDPVKMTALIVYSSLAKLVPSFLIIVFGGLLLRTLRKTKRHRTRLFENGTTTTSRHSDASRTTVMLLIVIVLFLVTELPQGILIMCCIFVEDFFENIYIPLGDVMDMLALLNNSINFILYCSMSQEFRRTFVRLFCSFSWLRQTRTEYIPPRQADDQLYTTTNIIGQNDEFKI